MTTRIISGLLAMMLLFTSASMALERVTPGGSGVIVICSGNTVKTVVVDDQGQPVTRHHVCPECVLSVALSPENPGWSRPDGAVLVVADVRPPPRPRVSQRQTGPLARAPPSFV